MRTKETDRIIHLYYQKKRFQTDTKNVAEAFPYFNRLVNELDDKSEKLYQLYLNEHRAVNVTTIRKEYAKKNAITKVLKLKRAVVLHAIDAGKKSLQRASNYTYSDFNRPSEETRTARFHQILNAAKRIRHPEQFGLSKHAIEEAEKSVKEYCMIADKPAIRKKERARQAKQCRKLLSEINFILRNKMTPFIENIKEEYPEAMQTLKEFLNPVKIGRPVESKRKSVSHKSAEKQNSASIQNNSTTLVSESGILIKQEV